MLSFLLVCDNTRNMQSTRTPRFDSKICDKGLTVMERTVIGVTQEVVQGIVKNDARVCQIVAPVCSKYKTQLDQLTNLLPLTDMTTAVQSFGGVLDRLFVGGHIKSGHVVTVLAFAGCVAQHCIRKEIIASNDVDQLAELMGRQLATRLISSQCSLKEFERSLSPPSLFEELPWRSIAFAVLGLGALAVLFTIH